MWKGIPSVLLVLCCCGGLATSVKVAVYYETLCIDSINFLLYQFYPTYELHADHLDLSLVAFGKATATRNNNTWTFECQHGPLECYGNKVHACAIDIYPVAVHTEFVVCSMRSGNASSDANLERCATENNITWSSLQECLNSGRGDDLLAAFGDLQNAVVPNISFVPSIAYNNIFSAPLQNLSLTNFRTTVEFLREHIECGGCHLSGASRTSNIGGILIFVVSVSIVLSKHIFEM